MKVIKVKTLLKSWSRAVKVREHVKSMQIDVLLLSLLSHWCFSITFSQVLMKNCVSSMKICVWSRFWKILTLSFCKTSQNRLKLMFRKHENFHWQTVLSQSCCFACESVMLTLKPSHWCFPYEVINFHAKYKLFMWKCKNFV